MSLFICMKCGCIENTNLIDRNVDTNKEYPNMHLMDMQVNANDDIDFKINMLCSECNTGIWHGEFPKHKANDREKEVAALSKYNAITPYDHPEGSISGFNDTCHVDSRYKLFIKLFGKRIRSKNNILFRIYLEDKSNFDIACLDWLELKYDSNGKITEENILRAIKSSQIYPSETKSKTFIEYTYTGRRKFNALNMLSAVAMSAGSNIHTNYLSNFEKRLRKNKPVQSEKDKQRMLQKAQLKRDIKALKKQPGYDKELLKQLQQEYKEL